jgi:hypothetical protein
MSQRIEIFITTAARVSYPTNYTYCSSDCPHNTNNVSVCLFVSLSVPSSKPIFWIYYMLLRPPLRSSDPSSWLQIETSGFDSRRYQIFWEVVGLERGPLSLVSTTEELLGRKSSGSGLEIREYGRRDPSRWPRGTFYPQKLPPTSPTSGGRSVGIVR